MTTETTDRLTEMLDHHWLYQGIETGVALCTCGEWSFDARVGRHPLPTMGERFAPFSHHVADVIRALMSDRDPIECAICGDYSAQGVEVHEVCLDLLSRTAVS